MGVCGFLGVVGVFGWLGGWGGVCGLGSTDERSFARSLDRSVDPVDPSMPTGMHACVHARTPTSQIHQSTRRCRYEDTTCICVRVCVCNNNQPIHPSICIYGVCAAKLPTYLLGVAELGEDGALPLAHLASVKKESGGTTSC